MLIDNAGASHYTFHSSQTHLAVKKGKKTVTTESVSIENGKGVKQVEKSVNGKKVRSTHELTGEEIKNVMDRKFMPEFFVPCYDHCDTQIQTRKRTRKVKKGSK